MKGVGMKKQILNVLAGLLLTMAGNTALAAEVLGVVCETPPPEHCDLDSCGSKLGVRGNVTDPDTGRSYFLDYPCDLQEGEDVVFILNIHGAGSIGNWQRHYFPAMDLKEQYRLVVATPTAEGGISAEGTGLRVWAPAIDDVYLQNITTQVIEAFGADNIKAFWLAGHSQGGITSHRLVCTDFYKDKVDGVLSLSGGRIGTAQLVAAFGPPAADGTPPPARERSMTTGELPTCDFSHIYATGEHEIVAMPDTSPWAEKYSCDSRVHTQVVDTVKGWITDSGRAGYPVWGMAARPGTADVFTYPNCADGRVVADVSRLDKGHTEGLEPKITEQIVQLMVSAKGGKVASGSN